MTQAETRPVNEWNLGDEGPLDTTILFVDLVSSSEFASVLGLREYAEFVASFERLCREQCRHYFEDYLEGAYQYGRDYEVQFIGDELAIFMHTGLNHNDVYQLIVLAVMLKCGWLASPLNAQRIRNGISSTELAAGLHFGRIWAKRTESGFAKCGFAINLAKRTESSSREGERFRINVTDPAFKQINRRMRNLLFGKRTLVAMKGVVVPVGVYEVVESFLNPSGRLAPQFADDFAHVARQALASNTFDMWIHSCLQVWEQNANGGVTDDCLALCERVLNIDPPSAVALYYAAQGYRERGQLETARLYLEDLVHHWPGFGDGWLELGRLLKTLGDTSSARRALLQARRGGVAEDEEPLP